MKWFLISSIKKKERPTAATADDRLSLVLSYQRSDIHERKLKKFQGRLIELCDEFGYDVVGEVEIRPQSRSRDNTTVLNASIPVRLRGNQEEKVRIPNRESVFYLNKVPLQILFQKFSNSGRKLFVVLNSEQSDGNPGVSIFSHQGEQFVSGEIVRFAEAAFKRFEHQIFFGKRGWRFQRGIKAGTGDGLFSEETAVSLWLMESFPPKLRTRDR